MPPLLRLDVSPHGAQVALLHAAWQDYPEWEDGDEWVAYRAPSLSHPERPPYPGIAVATRDDVGPDGPRLVTVEVWSLDEPDGLNCVHETALAVGDHGVDVGNVEGGSAQRLMLSKGVYPLRVLVDADRPDCVTRVVFVVGRHVDRGAYGQ